MERAPRHNRRTGTQRQGRSCGYVDRAAWCRDRSPYADVAGAIQDHWRCGIPGRPTARRAGPVQRAGQSLRQ
eukprot:5368184-Lingulodinium_polyedra.AAC.1